jgi:hypothetical protein
VLGFSWKQLIVIAVLIVAVPKALAYFKITV